MFSKFSSYNIDSKSINPYYNGIGKQLNLNSNEFSSTFTTTNFKTYKEFKQNGNTPWSNNKYWEGTMSDNGCGITAISIILSGYNINSTPETLRQKYYPILDNKLISSELKNTYGINNTNFYYDNISLSTTNILNHLKTNNPILICVWNKPKANIWTKSSHYMVLLACDTINNVYVSNPNGLENTYNSSGWYNINEVHPYIAKALFIK